MIANKEQQGAINRLKGPLYISAGAGTGKTGTLTMRIAHAYSNDSEHYLTAYDQFLAATFTKAAAAELKIRVQHELRHIGYIEVAQSIDNAWISTLHALCARMLRNEALIADINPFFTVLDPMVQAGLLQQSFEEILEELSEGERTKLLQLFAHNKEKLFNCLVRLGAELLNVSDGYEALIQDEASSTDVLQIIARLRDLSAASIMRYRFVDGKKASRYIENTSQFLSALDSLEMLLGESSEKDFCLLTSMMFSREFTSRAGSEEEKDLYDQEQQGFYACAAELVLRHNYSNKVLLIHTARALERHYSDKKVAQGALDEQDLLNKTLQLFDEHPEVAERYQRQFKLIMVDEFQDTDGIQLAIIEYLTGTEYETLCTVGDEQQSIYGFRGADLEVYREHKATMDDKGAMRVKLDKNYRSHETIIELSNRIFGKAFGASGLPLKAAREEKNFDQQYGPERLVVCFQEGQLRNSRKHYRVSEARAIAQEFARLRDQGVSPGEMVLLLRGTSYAATYVSALQEQHLDAFVVKDSNFYHTLEVRIVIALIEVFAFEGDDAKLAWILKSPLFRLDDYELFQVGKMKNDCWSQLRKCAREQQGEGLVVAEKILRDAFARRNIDSLSIILKDVIESSAYDVVLLNKGAQGRAEYANVIKLISLVAEQEAAGRTDIHELAAYFCFNRDENQKEAPGVFLSSQNEAVRIMTIHASKGLEFPVVAIGGFVDKHADHDESFIVGAYKEKIVFVKNINEQMLIDSLGVEKTKGLEATLRVIRGFPAHKSSSYGEIPSFCSLLSDEVGLRRKKKQEAFEEEQRLFYVACTRAQETLIIGATYNFTSNDTGDVGSQAGLVQDLVRGLFDGKVPTESGVFSTGGFSGRVLVSICTPDDPTEIVSQKEDFSMDAGRFLPIDERPRHFLAAPSSCWLSYSALAHEISSQEEQSSALDENYSEDIFVPSDEVRPTILGEAVHSSFERMIHEGSFASFPSEETLKALMTRNGMNKAEQERLKQALLAMLSSSEGRYIEAALHDESCHVAAEVPFLLDLFEEGSIYLEGYIDLLVRPEDDETPWRIFDYKTGGGELDFLAPQECEAILTKRHSLQAQTYAYACFVAGAPEVHATFVYPERIRPDGALLSHTFIFLKEEELVIRSELQRLTGVSG